MEEIDKLRKMLNMLDIDPDQDTQAILDQLSPFYSFMLNAQCKTTEEGCEWEMKYLDEGKRIRISKKRNDKERGYVELDISSMDCEISNPEDSDLIAMKYYIVMGALM